MAHKGYIQVEDLDVYRVAEQLADAIWAMVSAWQYFARDTVGKQLVRACDSVGANIAEGGGDESSVENRRYLRHARRSLRETRFFLRRAYQRQLVTPEHEAVIKPLFDRIGPLLTGYFKTVDRRCRLTDLPTHRLTDTRSKKVINRAELS